MRLSIKFFKFCLPCVIGVALGGGANAQVYESKDAQGNTVFSDKPSPGAEVVKVAPTNSADPVAESPERPQSAKTPDQPKRNTGIAAAPDQQADDDYEPAYYGGAPVSNEEARQQWEEAKQRREEAGDKPGVNPPPRVETRPATPRPAMSGGRR
ncbi:MAG: hypothetical protein OEV88_12350 [Gammaproteobacteria bacterium]|nr:hypothetical protein [Gammaproteobacteria bacterium]